MWVRDVGFSAYVETWWCSARGAQGGFNERWTGRERSDRGSPE